MPSLCHSITSSTFNDIAGVLICPAGGRMSVCMEESRTLVVSSLYIILSWRANLNLRSSASASIRLRSSSAWRAFSASSAAMASNNLRSSSALEFLPVEFLPSFFLFLNSLQASLVFLLSFSLQHFFFTLFCSFKLFLSVAFPFHCRLHSVD